MPKREDVHITYRTAGGRHASTIVTEEQRNAVHRAGALVRDRGSSRYLASADNWSSMFFHELKAPEQ